MRKFLNHLQFDYDGYWITPKRWCKWIWYIEYTILTKLYLWLDKNHPYSYYPTNKTFYNFIFWICFTNNMPTGSIINSEQADRKLKENGYWWIDKIFPPHARAFPNKYKGLDEFLI